MMALFKQAGIELTFFFPFLFSFLIHLIQYLCAEQHQLMPSSWVPDLPRSLPQPGFQLLDSRNEKFKSYLIQLSTRKYLMALFETLEGIKRRFVRDSGFEVDGC